MMRYGKTSVGKFAMSLAHASFRTSPISHGCGGSSTIPVPTLGASARGAAYGLVFTVSESVSARDATAV